MLVIFILFFLLIALRVPIAFSLGISSLVFLVSKNEILLPIPQRMTAAGDSFPLLAIPFFVLAGKLINESGITDRIFRFALCLVGHIRGGLAHVNVINSMIFAGMSGAAVADVGGIGAIEIKAMVDNGYEVDFSAGLTAASSTIAPIIPPSISMVVYGVLASTSVGALFLGGIIPGIIMGIFMMIYSYMVSVKRNYPRYPLASFKEFLTSLRDSFLGLMTPVILLGGIGLGIFTPTEAAAVVVLYSLFLGLVVYRGLKLAMLPRILLETVEMTAVITFVMTTATLFGWILTREQIPQLFAQFITSFSSNVYVVLALINILVLIMGCFLDGISVLVIIVPILLPIVGVFDIDRVHFGVMLVLNTVIGLITPPVGVVLYATVEVAKISFERVVRATLPFLYPLIASLIVATYFPWVILFIPRLLGFG
jgi:tripartite ATP-independent transporter DctM subunit